MKISFLIALATGLLMNGSFANTTNHFPVVSGKDLNEKPWIAPSGFPGGRTLVVIGFDEEQQPAIDSWFKGMRVQDSASKIPWIEMPLIDNPGMFMRWFINTGMRGGIPSKEARSHVWTAYTDKKSFMKASGMTSTTDVYALVVDRKGKILAMESGNYSKKGGEVLVQALQQ